MWISDSRDISKMEAIQKIGQLIQQRRDQLRITQRQLADMANIGINTLYKIETGQANPTLQSLQKITDILGMEITLQTKKVSAE